MKREFAEFLLKRLRSKTNDVANASDAAEVERIVEDIDEYLSVLSDVIKEALLP